MLTLNQYLVLQDEILALNAQKKSMMEVRGLNYDTVKVQTSKESHPMIDKKIIDPKVFRDKVEKYLTDYDNGEYNDDQVKAYVGKHRIRKVFHND